MSGVAVILRQRHRAVTRPWDHRTKAEYVEAMRGVALSVLRLPGIDEDGVENANALLEMVGDMLGLPRSGWYPRRPKGWRA